MVKLNTIIIDVLWHDLSASSESSHLYCVMAVRRRKHLALAVKTIESCQTVTERLSDRSRSADYMSQQATCFSAAAISWLWRGPCCLFALFSASFLRKALPSCPISWLPTTGEAAVAALWLRVQSPCNCWAELIQRRIMWRATRSMIGWLRDAGRSITDMSAQYLNIRLQTHSVWRVHLK